MARNPDAVALYWDFENLHAGLLDQQQGYGAYRASCFRPQDELIDVAAVVEFALSRGPVAINRAFANWVSFTRYRFALLRSAVELIQVFSPGANAKNGADIKLCLDVMDDMARFPHIGTVIVVGGDSDYMPLSMKVKAAGRTLVGIGSQGSTNQHWARSCHEFKYYETLLPVALNAAPVFPQAPDAPVAQAPELPAAAVPVPSAAEAEVPAGDDEAAQTEEIRRLLDRAEAEQRQQQAAELVCRAVSLLCEHSGQAWVSSGALRPFLQRMDPTFHEARYGFDTFDALLDSLGEVVQRRRGDHDEEVRLVALDPQDDAAAG